MYLHLFCFIPIAVINPLVDIHVLGVSEDFFHVLSIILLLLGLAILILFVFFYFLHKFSGYEILHSG